MRRRSFLSLPCLPLVIDEARGAPPAPAARTVAPVGPAIAAGAELFGVNYVWHLVPAEVFPAFSRALGALGVGAMRYPGGRVAEKFDWRNNRAELDDGNGPGVDPDTFLRAVRTASFVSPSLPAIRDPSRLGPLTERTVRLVRRFGGRVRTWEVGNEWWLQRGAKRDERIRTENFGRYAALLRSVAPAIRAADPGVAVFATGDWTRPEEFAVLRDAVGPAGWDAVDGLSIHPYCGSSDPDTTCASIPERAAAIRRAAGKARLYASEWSLGTHVNPDDWGIRNAGRTLAVIGTLARAGIGEAAYWPPMRGAASIALLDADGRATATGLAFGWAAAALREGMIPVSDAGSLAGRPGGGRTTVLVPAGAEGASVAVPLAPFGARTVLAAEVMAAADPDDPAGATVATIRTLPVETARGVAGFALKPWEIARVTIG